MEIRVFYLLFRGVYPRFLDECCYIQSVELFIILLLVFIHYLQLGTHPVAAVITCYISTNYEDFPLKFRYGGLHEKYVVATWNCRDPSQH